MDPLSPAQARREFNKNLPKFVIEAANFLIVSKLDSNGCASFTYKELESEIRKRMPDEAYNQKWLDIEDAFRISGWNVEVDNPGYCESYQGHYKFSPKKG